MRGSRNVEDDQPEFGGNLVPAAQSAVEKRHHDIAHRNRIRAHAQRDHHRARTAPRTAQEQIQATRRGVSGRTWRTPLRQPAAATNSLGFATSLAFGFAAGESFRMQSCASCSIASTSPGEGRAISSLDIDHMAQSRRHRRSLHTGRARRSASSLAARFSAMIARQTRCSPAATRTTSSMLSAASSDRDRSPIRLPPSAARRR